MVWPPLASAGAAFLLLIPSFGAPLFWDDHVHLFFARKVSLGWVFSHGLLNVYFRPLGEWLIFLIGRAGWMEPVGAHVVTALLAAASAAAVASLLLRWTRDEVAAALGGLLTATAPATVVAAAWLSNLYAVLAVALGLLATLTVRRPVLAVVLALSAGLAKEDGLLWLVPVLVLVSGRRDDTRTARKALAVAGIGTIALLAWRQIALHGQGGVLRPTQLLARTPGGPIGIALLLIAFIAALRWLRTPLARAAAAYTIPALALGWTLHVAFPADPYGLWKRFLFPALVGAVLLTTCWFASLHRPLRRVALLLGVGLVLLGARASFVWQGQWIDVTQRAASLSSATTSALTTRPDLSGPVWIAGSGDEIALSAAVGRRSESLLQRVVPLNQRGINLVVCPAPSWLEVRRQLNLSPLPGNPTPVAGYVVAVGFPRPRPDRRAPVLPIEGATP